MTTQIKIRIINKAGNRLAGARVAIFDGDTEIRSFVSADGESSFEPGPEYAAHLLRVRVSKGKAAQEDTCRLEGDIISLTFELEEEGEHPPPPPPQPLIKRLLIPAGLVLLGLIVWLVWSLIPSPGGTLGTITPARPRIISFTADPEVIQSGTRSRLAWEVEGADSAEISPNVGRVRPSGQSAVAPSQTTTYTLVARNAAGEASDEVTIRVGRSETFEISSLRPASPARLSAGDDSITVTLRYSLHQDGTLNVIPLDANKRAVANVGWQAKGDTIFSGKVGSRIDMPVRARSGEIVMQFKAMQPAQVSFLRLQVARGKNVSLRKDVEVNYRFVR